MTRNLKVLGLSVVALVAMSVAMASAAQASEFTSASTPVEITASASENSNFETQAGTITCKKATFAGKSTVSPTPTMEVSTVAYSECTFLGFVGVTVEMNGCGYNFHAGTTTGTSKSSGTADVVCPTGKKISFSASGLCTVTVGPQTGVGPVAFSASGGTITVSPNITNISYSQSGSLCSTVTASTGKYFNGKSAATGHVPGTPGTPISLGITP